jgi:hypothetical protein
VARYVSLGRRAVDHQPDGTPYPDAKARRALGVLDDAGLLTTERRLGPLLGLVAPGEVRR